jgi:L-threonylcarbamoyladenylate synthase
LREAVRRLRAGGVIAYPTEAVFGLGCDPLDGEAVLRLLAFKRRPWEKGLILIASDFAQLEPFLLPLSGEDKERVLANWPGPVTWLLPARPEVPRWLRGSHDTIAVRVSDHPLVVALCRAFGGALVSTSANLAGKRPARSVLAVRRQFGARLDYILYGPLGGRTRPSAIRDLESGRVIRP